jgi:serine/threonine protein kinase
MTAQLFPPGAYGPDDAASPLLDARFRLEDQLGTDEDAAVWRASDERLRRTVTIHMLPPPSVTPELANAVRAAAGISDPRLARIFDVAYDDERPYLVSEWAPGNSIEELLAAGSLAPRLAGDIIADAAEALAIAHHAGVAHLCLGPQSLRWGGSGVKITGLGIEAALHHAQAADPAATDTRALGRMLYALLTGYWPGSERTSLPPAPRRRGRWCPPRKIRAVPRSLSTICVRALPDAGRNINITEPDELALALRRAGPRTDPGW